MSVLVVGISHKSASVQLLEKAALGPDDARKLTRDVSEAAHVTEATVLSTCNRTEVYAEVDRFHGSVETISALMGERAGAELTEHLYVHYDDGAVAHLFNVASGLDSVVVGESQILGQAREALRLGQELGTIGSALNLAFQQALRVGKRAHAESEVDRAAPSVVTEALTRAAAHVGPLHDKRVLVVGAGSLASLAVATARSVGAQVTVANRTDAHAQRLAETYGARVIALDEVPGELATAEVVVSCTGATGLLLTVADVSAHHDGRPLAVVDLALPHDVDPRVAGLPGISLTTLASLSEELRESPAGAAIDEVRSIVNDEVSAFLAARHSASVTPTLVALRTMATGVVEGELDRLQRRLPDLSDAERAEVANTLRRVAEKLLHQPTVRVKELAADTGGVSYATALAELFSLDQGTVEAVTRAEEV